MHFQPSERPEEDMHFTHAGDDYMEGSMNANDPLDDVFGSGPVSPTERHEVSSTSHPSDMNRLRTEHTTAGYREGVTVAKETSIQAGFDEGFSLGATLGLRAGQLLGTLEGVADAVRGSEASTVVDKLLAEARHDLSKANIFSGSYWAPDGNWTYEVGGGNEPDEILFADVAAAHPLIRKWTEIVHEQMRLWKIDASILDDGNNPRLDMSDEHVATGGGPAPSARKPLDW